MRDRVGYLQIKRTQIQSLTTVRLQFSAVSPMLKQDWNALPSTNLEDYYCKVEWHKFNQLVKGDFVPVYNLKGQKLSHSLNIYATTNA